jgi:hypothetical protein
MFVVIVAGKIRELNRSIALSVNQLNLIEEKKGE